MEISRKDAIDLLRKWLTENRVIHFSILANKVFVKQLGRIDSVENEIVHFSETKSTNPLGDKTFIEFPLKDCSFEYDDAARAPAPLPDKLKGYDALMTIHRSGVSLGLAVLPPLEEWAKF